MQTPSHVVVKKFLLNVKIRYLLLAFWTFFNNSSVKTSFPCNSSHCSICSFHFFPLTGSNSCWLSSLFKRALWTGNQDYLLSLWRFLAWLPHNNCFAVSNTHTQGHLKKRKMAAAIGQNPFNLTAAGELGAHRETMLNNELLLRVSVDFQFIIIPIVIKTNEF